MTPYDFWFALVFERLTPATLARLYADFERMPDSVAQQIANLVRAELIASRGEKTAQELIALAREHLI